jgi:hypothetical protein
MDVCQQLLEEDQLGRLTPFLYLLSNFLQDIETVVYIHETHLPLTLYLPMIFLNFTPLAQRPLRKTWNNAVYFERRVSAV